MIGLIFATSEEARNFLRDLPGLRADAFQEGTTERVGDLLVAATGTGKIKATLHTERLLVEADLDRIFHLGTAAALNDELEVGALFGASFVLEGDRVELSAPAYPRMPLDVVDGVDVTGTLVTQDHTVGGDDRSYWQRLADANDTNAYPVAYVAAQHGVPCQVVKAITGHVGQDSETFQEDRQQALRTLTGFAHALVSDDA